MDTLHLNKEPPKSRGINNSFYSEEKTQQSPSGKQNNIDAAVQELSIKAISKAPDPQNLAPCGFHRERHYCSQFV